MVPDEVVSAVRANVLFLFFIIKILAWFIDAVRNFNKFTLDGDDFFFDWVLDGVEGEREFAFLTEVNFFTADAVVDVTLLAKTSLIVDHESVSTIRA